MNIDPIQHYCGEILELQEGGSKIDDATAGLTSDMGGRWTIGAFQHKKANKNETPKMKEAIYPNNAGIMEVFQFFEKANESEKELFDKLVNKGEQNAALQLMEKVLGIKFHDSLVQRG